MQRHAPTRSGSPTPCGHPLCRRGARHGMAVQHIEWPGRPFPGTHNPQRERVRQRRGEHARGQFRHEPRRLVPPDGLRGHGAPQAPTRWNGTPPSKRGAARSGASAQRASMLSGGRRALFRNRADTNTRGGSPISLTQTGWLVATTSHTAAPSGMRPIPRAIARYGERLDPPRTARTTRSAAPVAMSRKPGATANNIASVADIPLPAGHVGGQGPPFSSSAAAAISSGSPGPGTH